MLEMALAVQELTHSLMLVCPAGAISLTACPSKHQMARPLGTFTTTSEQRGPVGFSRLHRSVGSAGGISGNNWRAKGMVFRHSHRSCLARKLYKNSKQCCVSCFVVYGPCAEDCGAAVFESRLCFAVSRPKCGPQDHTAEHIVKTDTFSIGSATFYTCRNLAAPVRPA